MDISILENTSDVISRQDAIAATMETVFVEYEDGDPRKEESIILQTKAAIRDRIKDLPSVQPEIIHCKDCKFYGRADKRRFYRGSDCLNKRIDTIVPDRDFCSRAERCKAK